MRGAWTVLILFWRLAMPGIDKHCCLTLSVFLKSLFTAWPEASPAKKNYEKKFRLALARAWDVLLRLSVSRGTEENSGRRAAECKNFCKWL